MADTAELQALLASLDQETAQLAEFHDMIEAPTPHGAIQTVPSSAGGNNAAQPSQTSIRKIDDLLGSLNAKQQEWESKVLASQANSSIGAPVVGFSRPLGLGAHSFQSQPFLLCHAQILVFNVSFPRY